MAEFGGKGDHQEIRLDSRTANMALRKLINLPQLSLALSADEQPLGFFFTEYRINASYEELPKHLIYAVISAEDKRFFSHKGFDPISLLRACWKNVKNLAIIQGGSTITQQLARVAIIRSNRRTLKRKLLELLAAIKLEKSADKKQILEAYLNAIYFGYNMFGVKTAALEYFGKDVSELDLNESAYLAGLIRGPNRYCLNKNGELGNKRKDRVLELMHKNNLISESDLVINKGRGVNAPYFCKSSLDDCPNADCYYLDYLKKYLLENHGDVFPFTQMLVKTAFDKRCQDAITQTITEFPFYDREHKISCLILDKSNGGVKALSNGLDFSSESFNIAVNGYLQPGSTIKPFILAQALKQGFSLESKFESKKLSMDLFGKKWEVGNFNEIYRGHISLAEALIYSDNTVYAQLIFHLNLDELKAFLKTVGIEIGLLTPALATGAISGGISPLQVAAAYTVFSNKGFYLPPTPIIELRKITGQKLFESRSSPRYVLDHTIASEIDDVLKRVTTEGTGVFTKHNVPNLRAKTGTTNTESWYVSYNEKYHLVTWVGEKPNFERHIDARDATPPRNTLSREDRSGFSEKTEKAVTAKQLAERIWEYLRIKRKLGEFCEVAKSIHKLNSAQVTELEGYFMPWGKNDKVYH